MANMGWFLFCALFFFLLGYAQSYGIWKERAINGDMVEIKGKVYKIVEMGMQEKEHE